MIEISDDYDAKKDKQMIGDREGLNLSIIFL